MPDPTGLTPSYFKNQLLPALGVGCTVFVACLIGIFTRFDSNLSSFWIANSLMLGMMLRLPHAATLTGWGLGILAFIAADVLTGSDLHKAAVLTLLNFVGIGTIYLIYQRFPAKMLRLNEPLAVLKMALACGAGALACSIPAALITPMLFNENSLRAGILWLVTEFVNYIAIFPMMLAVPAWPNVSALWRNSQPIREFSQAPLPLLGLLISGVATLLIGGPGAIAFAVPALLWCAIRYSVFSTTLLTFFSSLWLLVLLAQANHYEEQELISLRLGVALLTLGPIMLACLTHSHNKLLASFKQMAEQDDLTGTHNRAAFLTQAQQLINQSQGPIGVMMIDLDHFKQVNDQHGHAAGDQVLISVTARIRNCLRSEDLLGRLGGEEFAVVLAQTAAEEIPKIAERIRATIAKTAISLANSTSLHVTTSVGLLIASDNRLPIDRLLAKADKALYQAKHQGRNCVVLAKVESVPSTHL